MGKSKRTPKGMNRKLKEAHVHCEAKEKRQGLKADIYFTNN